MADDDRLLDLEMAFASQHDTSYVCGDLYDPVTRCRRERGHVGLHASGYGAQRRRWAA